MRSNARNITLSLLLSICLCGILAGVILAAPPGPAYQLEIDGNVPHPVVLTPSDFARLTSYSVEAKNHDGSTSKYEGPLLIDVLKLSGLTFGDSVRGARLTTYILAIGSDNYKVAITIPEFDPSFTDHRIIVAVLRDGQPLSPKEGPLHLILPDEKRPTRCVRQLKELTVVQPA